MLKLKLFILKHSELFTVLGLGLVFYIVFFHNIGDYALMDVDESRYVSMARDMFLSKDFLTLYLNNEFFFEKPPLYFWGECLSFALFGEINEFTARFPVALYGSSVCYLIYIMGRKIVSRSYGVISALILATSLEFLILSKFAILDIVVSTCIAFSISSGLVVYFCRESRKKYYWWLFYLFSALAVMAKGILGFVIPFGTMFIIALVSKKLKEAFRPLYCIPGILIFLLITLPWHIVMFKLYNPLFWDEYIVKHHLARFFGSEVINREQPFYFYLITLTWGFFPWIISCVFVWFKNLQEILKKKFSLPDFDELNTAQRFMYYNFIVFMFILVFFSISGTKLITYILPIYGSLSCLGGYVWWNYILKKEHEELINKSSYFLAVIFLIASLAAILTPLYLPAQLLEDISNVRVFTILSTFATGFAVILFLKKRIYVGVFASFVLFMAFYSAIATEKYFEVDYKFGQDDLMEFAKYAKENDKSLTTFNFGKKYSLLFYAEKPVFFKQQLKPESLSKELKCQDNFVIIQNKDIKKFENIKYATIKTGRKYTLIEEK